MSEDPRIEIPAGIRNLGILGGIILMVLGLLLGWVKSGRSVELPVTGVKRPPKEPGLGERIVEALLSRLTGAATDQDK